MINASGLLNAISQTATKGQQKTDSSSVSDSFLSLLQQIFSGSGDALANSMDDLALSLVPAPSDKQPQDSLKNQKTDEQALAQQSSVDAGRQVQQQQQIPTIPQPIEGAFGTGSSGSQAEKPTQEKCDGVNKQATPQGADNSTAGSKDSAPKLPSGQTEGDQPQPASAQTSQTTQTTNQASTAAKNAAETATQAGTVASKKICETVSQTSPIPGPVTGPTNGSAATSATQASQTDLQTQLATDSLSSPASVQSVTAQTAKAAVETALSNAAVKPAMAAGDKGTVDSLVQNLKFASRIDSFGELFSPSNVTNAESKALLAKLATSTKNLPQSSQSAIIDKLKEVVDKASQTRVGNSVVVRLNPPELGDMTVKVSFRDDQMFVRVVSDNPDVEKFMRDKAPEMVQVLAAAGFKANNVHLSVSSKLTDAESFSGYLNANQQPGNGNGAGNGFYKRGNNVTLAQNLQTKSVDPALGKEIAGKAAHAAGNAGWVA